ncbi:MAG TPA: hypothetical protein VIC62_16685, partial [Nakamurella sp.]
DEWITAFTESVRASDAECEAYLDYAGGHLFTDAARREEFDAHSTTEAFGRALEFLDRLDRESGER